MLVDSNGENIMRGKKLLKLSFCCLVGTFIFAKSSVDASTATYTSGKAVAGISIVLEDYVSRSSKLIGVEYNSTYKNLGIANVKSTLNVRKGPGENYKRVGNLPKDAGCEIIEMGEEGWAKIKSGKVEGYVKASYLITGKEALQRASEVASHVATITASALRLREEPSLLASTLATLPRGEELSVVEIMPGWVHVKIDSDDAYVSSDYVELSYELKKGVTIEELQTGETGLRADMVAFARRYLGGRYVWGGTTLGKGVDCSGYVQAIYKKFGYSIPRVSRSQASSGRTIKASNARPGDLFFYGKGNYINHVGMYIGNGKIIHASNPRSGIKISNAYYRKPVKVVRYIND